jgi:ATP-dependent DNA helicase RecG
MLTDEELARLARDLESDRIERKESLSTSAKERVGQAICAFANDLPGHGQPGVILVGVDDAGEPVGTPVTDKMLLDLAAYRSDGNILPLPNLVVEKRSLGGKDVAVVVVQPASDPPVRYYGQVWIRIGPRRAIASRDEERVLTERRQAGDLPFDRRHVPHTSRDQLDLELFQSVYLPAAVAPEVLEENHRSIQEQLAALHLIARNGAPTYAALLLLGKTPRSWLPGAYVQFVRLDGEDLTAPILDQKEIASTSASRPAWRRVRWSSAGRTTRSSPSSSFSGTRCCIAPMKCTPLFTGTGSPIASRSIAPVGSTVA